MGCYIIYYGTYNDFRDTFMKNNKGFTLMEMMVVIAIIAIIATLAVPSMRTTIQRSQVSEQTQQLSTFLQESRGKAVIRRVPYETTIASGVPGGFTDTSANGSGSWAPDSDKVTVVATPATTPITFSLMGQAGTEVCYAVTHINNPALTQVVILDRNGATLIRKDLTACP